MTYIETDDGVRIHVQDLGTGPAVVLMSGFGLDGDLWDRQVRMLTEAGYRTVCITQRGHGRSDHPLGPYDMDRLAADVVTVLEQLNLGPATVIGHSFSGQVTFHATAIAPHLVSKLILVGSNAVRASRSEDFPFGAPPEPMVARMVGAEQTDRIAIRYQMITSSFAGDPDPRVVEWLMRTWMQMPSWSAIACYRTMLPTDLMADLPKVTLPVLQIVGISDPVHSVKGARWVQSALADATLVEIDCGHFPMLEAPDEFDEALLKFIAAG